MCVRATEERHTEILCQNNNLGLTGGSLFYTLQVFDFQSLDGVIFGLRLVHMTVLRHRPAVCVTPCVSGKTADTGGESVRAVIYGDLLHLALCWGLPLGLAPLAHILFPFSPVIPCL